MAKGNKRENKNREEKQITPEESNGQKTYQTIKHGLLPRRL